MRCSPMLYQSDSMKFYHNLFNNSFKLMSQVLKSYFTNLNTLQQILLISVYCTNNMLGQQ